MLRKLLIVDDIRSNREILKNILAGEYSIVEAAHGQEAVAIMSRDYRELSAVLLDLGMPVMDGFQVLSYMSESETLSQLPVIVTTGQTDSDSEERALQLGAKDYISKPYKSAIIKQRIWNTINLREKAATVNALQRDRLTGLYSREAFFERVAERVAANGPGHYTIACFDIDNFKVINNQYGTAKGDEVLRHVADVFTSGFEPLGGVCCRVMADNFAVLYPSALLDTALLENIRARFGRVEGLASPLTFSIGRYIITDLSLTPSAMYDRATLAEDTVKGLYGRNVAMYDETMLNTLLEEQRIVTEMDGALRARQFEVWFQPQYNHTTGVLIGAEALVRWRHPERGLIPPGDFIPIFEKNGFIYELDKYVWEETCRYLRKWTDAGPSPLPVSVNVSRYDILLPGLVGELTGLVEKYAIPAELLRLEITESAFAENTQQIVDIVKELIARGFTVEIDDFGSGYSSLNTLKSVPAQVVKLDMRFLRDSDDSQRGGNILESIVRMTKWIGMSVIAEGVETREQADFLKSIGCSYVQGYLYARPMPAEDYEKHCSGVGHEKRLLTIETVENMDNNAFWNPKSMDTLIFNSFVGAACIFEHFNGSIELLRANDKFAAVLGNGSMTVEDTLRLDWIGCLDAASRDRVRQVIRTSAETGAELSGEYVFLNIPGGPEKTYLRATMRVIASVGERLLVYCTSENITAQRLAERRERRVMKQLQSIMDNVNCGITAVTIEGEDVKYLLSNDRYFDMLGYTRAQYEREVGSRAFTTVHPEDRGRVAEAVARVAATGTPSRLEFRALRRDGSAVWVRCNTSMTSFEGVETPVQLSTYVDVTGEKQASQELLDNLPGGAALYEYDGEGLTAIHLNKRYWQLVNRAPVSYDSLSVLDSVYPDDAAIIAGELESSIRQNRPIACDIRLRFGSEGYRPFHVAGRAVPRADGKYSIYASYTPISDEAMSIQEMLPIALSAVMSSSSDLAFVKDRDLRYICCSQAFAHMVGLKSERDVAGKSDYDLFDAAFADQYVADDRALIESGRSIVDRVETIPSEDGRSRYSNTSKYLLYDSQGNVVGLFGTGRDITRAREMQSQLELLTNSVPGGIAVYEGRPDALDRIALSYFSDGFCRLFGYTREEYEKLAAQNPLGLVFSEDLPNMLEQVMALVRDGAPMDLVYRARINGGGFKWINVKAVMGEPNGESLTVNAVFFDVTGRQEALARLRMSEEENRLAMQHSRNVVCRYDVASRTLTISPRVNPIFGLSGVIEGVPYGEVRAGRISPETSATYIALYERIIHGDSDGSLVYQRKSSQGWRWVESHFSTIFSDDGAPVSAVISFMDVTESVEKEAAYRKWQQSLHEKEPGSYSLFRCNISRHTMFDTVEGSLLSIRFEPGEFDFDERTAEYVSQCVHEDDSAALTGFLNAESLLSAYYQGKRSVTAEYRETLPGGGVRWLRLSVDLVEHPHSADVEAYLLFEDIDEAKRAELKTLEQAASDPLTGVMNRTTFESAANSLLRASRPGVQHALMMLDIDGFKLVNDVFGHRAGDQTLIDIADGLRAALRRGDLVGRLGGDEFVILLADIPGDAAAAAKASQICALTRRAFSMEVEISGSVGITVAPRDGADFETLYKKADAALYHVKGSGKDNYTFYHEDMADEHLELESPPEPGGLSAQRGKKRRMLIVDDSRTDHALLSSIFEGEFIIETARDGGSALIRLRHYGAAISVVLLDLMMPGMDGFAVLEKMRQSQELRTIPVVVVSGDGNRETSLRAIRFGASDFVIKPVDPDVLRIRVQSAVSKAENERLRAKNSLLEYQSGEVIRYRTVLERSGVVVVEHDWISGTFIYDRTISEHLDGLYDSRKLWRILLADMVGDTDTVRSMQELVHAVATDRQKSDQSILVLLKTPSKERHWFRMCVYKHTNEFGLAGKIYLTFTDLGASRPEGA